MSRPRMSRKGLLAGLTVWGIGGSLVAGAAGPLFAPEPPETAGEPFSAVAQTESTTLFSDGNRIVRTNTVHYYRDGQGRTRVERAANMAGPAASGVDNTIITISDPVAGEHVSLIPQMKTATVFKLPGGNTGTGGHIVAASVMDTTAPFALLGFGMGIGANGLSTESSAETTTLGQKVVNGVSATGTKVVRVIPVGVLGNEKPITSTLEEWKSTELGLPVQIIEKSSLGGTVTYNLQQVVRAEPDPTLFQLPEGYTRRDIGGPMAVSGTTTSHAIVTSVAKKP
jgi:hypothetical protein